MKSSLILRVALLLTITHIAQARKLGCTSCGGGLSSGTNPCKCEDVVVKAAKVQKPLYHATPEAINEAAAVRESGSTTTFPGNVVPFSQYSQTSRLYGVSSGISHSSSSSSSSSSASSSSTVNFLGGSVGRDLSSFDPFARKYESGCGCGSKSKVELNSLLSSNTQAQIVPRFPPIGDLCTPNKLTRDEVSTKVTPAYPKLNFQQTVEPVCVNVVNGQIDKADLSKLASYSGTGGLFGGPIGTTGSLGGYTSNIVSNTLGYKYGGSSSYGSSSSSGFSLGYKDGWGNIDRSGTTGSLDTGWYRIKKSYTGSNIGSNVGIELNSGTSRFGGYGTSYGSVYAQEPIDRNGCTDFGEDLELPEDYSYPRQPADAVSLTLAYKNLFPYTVVHNKRWFVPEDKLAFGHRTVPVESLPSKKPSDIPEEQLQILDKPIVELKPAAPISVSLGVYNEQEEAKLAELEAIERERINQEETASQPRGNFITYGDLGYAPVDGFIMPGRLTKSGQINSGIGLSNTEDVIGEGCGPMGPPLPGYVPGTIVVNREVVEIEGEDENDNQRSEDNIRHYLDDVSDEEDDIDDTTSGIFAKLKSTAQKYGPVMCPR
ncbi:PREDICTED: uncharacterized protein LOC106741898 [Dinoponera quadriceps]|uniref:Uncharacterized protein LOC106741898 n=1 Tax=Dinoponera quadriceps TaxID=609295 RepID=A0A6P3WUG2_DINQU|nr:PREDICTED: uncharacterized protein LOC106741898 [Dinoponera quadriceps]